MSDYTALVARLDTYYTRSEGDLYPLLSDLRAAIEALQADAEYWKKMAVSMADNVIKYCRQIGANEYADKIQTAINAACAASGEKGVKE